MKIIAMIISLTTSTRCGVQKYQMARKIQLNQLFRQQNPISLTSSKINHKLAIPTNKPLRIMQKRTVN